MRQIRSFYSTILLIVVLSLLIPAFAQKRHAPGSILALTHVSVIDVSAPDAKAALRQEQTVIINGSRIAAIGAKVRIPPGGRVVDATGTFLIPGLWDMHVHTLFAGRTEFFFPLFIANGVTGVREMSSTFAPGAIQQMRSRLESGEVVGPRIGLSAIRIVEGKKDSSTPGFEYVTTPEEGREIVRLRKRQGADFIKVYNLLSRDVYFAIVDEAKRQHIPIAGHVPFEVSALEASNAGQRSIEHLTRVLWACSRREDEIRSRIRPTDSTPGGGLIAGTKGDVEAIESFDTKKAATLFARFRSNGTAQCPTLVQLRKFASTADPAFVADSRLKYVPLSVRQMWQERLKGQLKEVFPYAVKVYPKQVQLVHEMQEAGVTIIAGTDAGWGNPYTFPGFSLHDELELLVRAGLSPLEALRTATVNPAIFMNARDRFGTVEKGRMADLVLLDANPLEDIANTRRISAVVLNGQFLSARQLQQMLTFVEQEASMK
jgi:Amidohydrolase family